MTGKQWADLFTAFVCLVAGIVYFVAGVAHESIDQVALSVCLGTASNYWLDKMNERSDDGR